MTRLLTVNQKTVLVLSKLSTRTKNFKGECEVAVSEISYPSLYQKLTGENLHSWMAEKVLTRKESLNRCILNQDCT